MTELIIAARFNGPPETGNGGYTAGLLAAELPPGPAAVTLRRPPPLATPCQVVPGAGGSVELRRGDLVIAVARPAPDPIAAPPALGSPADAAPYAGFTEHPFPSCYVCGPQRSVGDGLRIFPGLLPDGRTAANWRAPEDVDRMTVWAALDCPGGWAVIGPGRPYVLGQISVTISALPSPGEECLIMGECTGREGRKGLVSSALYTASGVLLAHSQAIWISI